jgi:signal transduction histidine kinase/CheY-like chemotaxis protein
VIQAQASDQEQGAEASVLVVDDVPANLLALKAVLDPLGVRLVEASSGAQAIALAEKEQFALILLDVQMPVIDGFEVAKRLRQTESARETPIIFLTAIHRDEGYARTGYRIGGADYLLKPLDPDILRARTRAFVDLFNQREQLRKKQVQTRTDERDEAIRQLVAFERIATAALETANIDAFLRTLLGVFHDAAGSVAAAGILLREGDHLEARASLGFDDGVASGFRERIGEGFAGTIAARREPLHLANAADSPLVRSAWVRNSGLRGLFGVPLVSDSEVFGVAFIGSVAVSDFSPADRRLFAAVAEKAASAVERVRSRKRVEELLEAEKAARRDAEEAVRRQTFLAEVSGVLSSSLDIDATLDAVVRMTVPDFADWCAADLVDADGALSTRAFAHGDPAKDEPWSRFVEGAEAFFGVARVVAANRASVVSSVEPSPAAGPGDPATELGIRSWMCVPLRRPGGVIGALSIASTKPGRSYGEGSVAFADEVAIRVAMAVENAELYRRAQVAIRIREDFVSIASHELKTPLTPLKLQLASLQRRLPEDRKTLMDRLAIADRQVDKIEELVSQLLDVSKIAAGRFELERQWIDLGRIVERVVERFATNPLGSTVRLRGDGVRAFLDPFRMEQLVTNLVANAVKYGEGKPVEIELSEADERAWITVRDHGIGIGSREQARIFERFERAVSPNQYGGFGLGLWIVRQVVEASGGRVTVTSELGKGSAFTVVVPLGAEMGGRGVREKVQA